MDISNFPPKKGHNSGPSGWVSHLYHVYLHFTGIMCSKFHLDDLKNVGGV